MIITMIITMIIYNYGFELQFLSLSPESEFVACI